MHQKPFVVRAPPGPAERAHGAPRPHSWIATGIPLDMVGGGETEGGDGEQRNKGKR